MAKTLLLQIFLLYTLAALGEIGGCFCFWLWAREGKSPLWLGVALPCLIFFAWSLTKIPLESAGRTFAVYGGIYILSALLWLWLVEQVRPDKWDLYGLAFCLIGAGIIALAPHK
ncbi:YnfA family protein [Acetobacteraceae bacterium]|nr:YnfA family protein [Acetobacteraceae bacterium]